MKEISDELYERLGFCDHTPKRKNGDSQLKEFNEL